MEKNEGKLISWTDGRRDSEWWLDEETGNRWSKDHYTKSQAERYAKAMVKSRNCVNSIGLKNCERCIACAGCQNCYKCVSCRNCKDCTLCRHCQGCVDCHECDTCNYCIECSKCVNCYDDQEDHRTGPFSFLLC